MKTLANELDIAVIVVSQFNRTAKGEKPQLWHLKESSAIEQDASLVMMIHHDGEGDRVESEIIVRKQRHGDANFKIDALFDKPTCRFLPLAPKHLAQP